MTSAVPTMPAVIPSWIESLPRLAPTWRSSTILSGIGSAPALSVSARSCASCRLLFAERDLPVPADPALDHRRAALHPAVEQDRHEVAHVAAGLVAELAPAGAVELEGDDRRRW